jgi:thioredoxin-like negative regulator of GroEL
MQLAPEWTKLAKLLSKIGEVKIAKVDCVAEAELCRKNAIRSYPTLRLYPLESRGTSRYYPFESFQRDAQSLRQWAAQYLPTVVESLTPFAFHQQVAQGQEPYLVDFYAPCKRHNIEDRVSSCPQHNLLHFRVRALPAFRARL